MPKKRKPTAKKVGKKVNAAPPERDTKQSAPRQAATKAKARRAKKPALRPRVRVAAQRPDVTHYAPIAARVVPPLERVGDEEHAAFEAALPMRDGALGQHQPQFLSALDDARIYCELSVELEAQGQRSAYGTDASNPKGAEPAPFPTTRREK